MIADEERVLLEKFLRRLPVFQNISREHQDALIKEFSIVQLPKDHEVFFQSDESTDLYIIIKGSARASLMNKECQELVLATFKEGNFFGEMSLLDGKPRSATIILEEDSTLGILRRDVFLNAVKKEPMLAIDLLAALVERLRSADELIESLAFLDVSQRLLKHLVQLADEEGEPARDGLTRIKKYTQKEISVRIGASREAISKVLKVLTAKKIIQEEEGFFLITPRAKEACR